mmetsp:Transcript_28358/g.72890  ORF Transcript_28358/g.72890 Transcript_28358/m.72890 type:complete len:221 (-) Transcript_28358:324-986(-)
MASVRSPFLVLSASHIESLSPCHFPGASWFMMCTRMASKIARHSACSGTLMASSSAVSAGYLAALMWPSIAAGVCDLGGPALAATSSGTSNMNDAHAAHHSSPLPSAPSYRLITHGRKAGPEVVLMVLVMRSGMDASRLAPMSLSLRNSDTILRFLKSSSQRCATSGKPAQPSFSISAASCWYMAGVKTSLTGTSAAPGASTKRCTASMSSLYLGSRCVM